MLDLQQTVGNRFVSRVIQTKLKLGSPRDHYEQQADQVAERIMRAPESCSDSVTGVQPQSDKALQRTCKECEAGVQRKPLAASSERRASAQPAATGSLDGSTREFFEHRFGHDFADVRVHHSERAARMASAVKARAFTVGRDIFFGAHQYAPDTHVGRKLIAHELTHVIQQTGAPGPSQPTISEQATSAGMLQRNDEGSAASSSEPPATNFRRVTMHFNGAELIVSGDGREVLRFSASSGRPIRIYYEDARACGADVTTDSYLNDKRFVGIEDRGPIPEGSYAFSPSGIERAQPGEAESVMSLVGAAISGREHSRMAGHDVHRGDWGTGRVELHRRGRLLEGPCGNANRRSEFFLHGGVLAGSSGCIDVGENFDRLADFLAGYRRQVVVTVSYTEPPPSVGFFTGLGGAFAYSRFGFGHGPGLRLGAEFTPTETRGVASLGYDAVLRWAGGAAAAGVRLDVPFNDREAFVRVGLAGGVNFRIFRALYGQLRGGYSWDVSGPTRQSGPELGVGLTYDFGRVQLEALYNVLRLTSNDERVHQALIGIGFRFGD